MKKKFISDFRCGNWKPLHFFFPYKSILSINSDGGKWEWKKFNSFKLCQSIWFCPQKGENNAQISIIQLVANWNSGKMRCELYHLPPLQCFISNVMRLNVKSSIRNIQAVINCNPFYSRSLNCVVVFAPVLHAIHKSHSTEIFIFSGFISISSESIIIKSAPKWCHYDGLVDKIKIHRAF